MKSTIIYFDVNEVFCSIIILISAFDNVIYEIDENHLFSQTVNAKCEHKKCLKKNSTAQEK